MAVLEESMMIEPTGDLGWLGNYTTLLNEKKYHCPTLEITYGEDSLEDFGLDTEHEARKEAEAIRAQVSPWAEARGGEVLIEDDMPDRINVRIRYPLNQAIENS